MKQHAFLTSIHYFRAIAIFFVVSGHCFYFINTDYGSMWERIFANFIGGGTLMFVFVSGFLFYRVFVPRFNYKNFMSKKFKYVFLPYIFMGFLPLLYRLIAPKDWHDGYFLPDDPSLWATWLVPTLKYYATGRFVTGYWYIPFVMTLFLISPLHLQFCKIKTKPQILILILLATISIFMWRGQDNFALLQSIVYFTPMYLFGAFCSIHYDAVLEWTKRNMLFLVPAFLGLLLFESQYENTGSYHKNAFEYQGVDLMFLQKTIFILILIGFLSRFENTNVKMLNITATTSFAIFFLHPPLLLGLTAVGQKMNWFTSESWILFIPLVVACFTICTLIAVSAKKILPKYSRYLIGY